MVCFTENRGEQTSVAVNSAPGGANPSHFDCLLNAYSPARWHVKCIFVASVNRLEKILNCPAHLGRYLKQLKFHSVLGLFCQENKTNRSL